MYGARACPICNRNVSHAPDSRSNAPAVPPMRAFAMSCAAPAFLVASMYFASPAAPSFARIFAARDASDPNILFRV